MDAILTERRGARPISGTREDPSRRVYAYIPESDIARLDAIMPELPRAMKVRQALSEWLAAREGEEA